MDPLAVAARRHVTIQRELGPFPARATARAALTLRIAGGKDAIVKKSDIAHRENLKVSSMPEGLAAGMSSTEFLDIVSYLQERK